MGKKKKKDDAPKNLWDWLFYSIGFVIGCALLFVIKWYLLIIFVFIWTAFGILKGKK